MHVVSRRDKTADFNDNINKDRHRQIHRQSALAERDSTRRDGWLIYRKGSFHPENNRLLTRRFLPTAGYYSNGSLNNAGSDGGYWSSSLGTDSPSNAYYLYFGSGNVGMSYNGRGCGPSVRPVCPPQHLPMSHSYVLTREQLLSDLYDAYIEARRHKRSKPYVKQFESHLNENLEALCDELFNRAYKPRPSSCFIITDPKRREVFAAEFRDRVVHHLYYNYTHELFERTFIHDTYSCIKGRGTHFGISRLEQHIRQESRNYTVPCYVMKMDVRGYFMHIDRNRLLNICLGTLRKMAMHKVSKYRKERWRDIIDMGFVEYLTREIVKLDPTERCRIKGLPSDWYDLPHDKSLFNSPEGCGLPIGNLTSQLFSNVYLNELDQYMKRELKCRHYGRYVDDFYVVSSDREWLLSLVPSVRACLAGLGLLFHDGKLSVTTAQHGVEFLGAWLKPHRVYATRGTAGRMRAKLRVLAASGRTKWEASLNSFCGVLSHGANYRLRRRLMLSEPAFAKYGVFDMEYKRYFCC